MAVLRTVTLNVDLRPTETLEDAPAAAAASILSSSLNKGVRQYGPTAMTRLAAWKPLIVSASSGGAALEIDLLDLPGTQGPFSAAGLKLKLVRLQNPAANAGSVTIRPAVVDGYEAFGPLGEVTVDVGCELLLTLGAEAPVVGAFSGVTSRYLELEGETDDEYELELIFG